VACQRYGCSVSSSSATQCRDERLQVGQAKSPVLPRALRGAERWAGAEAYPVRVLSRSMRRCRRIGEPVNRCSRRRKIPGGAGDRVPRHEVRPKAVTAARRKLSPLDNSKRSLSETVSTTPTARELDEAVTKKGRTDARIGAAFDDLRHW
jgi:hypothetical protein